MIITGNTTLDGEHHGNIIIAKNGITLDCAGHDVTGDGSMGSIGINLVKRKNVTVKNCYVHDFTAGFVLNKSRGNTLEDNTAINNSVDGFFAFRSSNNRLVENTADINDGNGFRVVGESQNNTLEANEGMGNGNFDALDDAIPAGFDNDWVDNDFGTCAGFSDPPCPQ